MNKIWYNTKKGEYPVATGKYEKDSYPQIPCLIKNGHYLVGIRYFNITEDCWDDDQCDDYDADKDKYEQWCYIDDIMNME